MKPKTMLQLCWDGVWLNCAVIESRAELDQAIQVVKTGKGRYRLVKGTTVILEMACTVRPRRAV